MVCTRLNARTIRSEVRNEDGTLVGGGTLTLSADGECLTIANFGYDSQLREVKQQTLWNRQ